MSFEKKMLLIVQSRLDLRHDLNVLLQIHQENISEAFALFFEVEWGGVVLVEGNLKVNSATSTPLW